MNSITTKADVKKFLTLLKAGMLNGTSQELKIYSHASKYDGTNVVKEHYVHLELSFSISAELIDSLIDENNVDDEIKELLNNL